MVALDGFCTPDPTVPDGDRIVERGAKLRSDDPVVAKAKHLFAPDGLSDTENTRLRQALRPVEAA